MRDIFKQDATDGILLIDATNAFNSLIRGAALHNIRIACPFISTYLINMYRQPSKLFVTGGITLYSMEGTTQGDPMAMPMYSICTRVIIDSLRMECPDVRQAWLADDASAAAKLHQLFDWYVKLVEVGKLYGFLVNGPKCWLIVKTEEMVQLAKELFGNKVNITSEGKRHLGATIGSQNYKQKYCRKKVDKWIKELEILCEIADTQPHAAYSAFVKGYKSKFPYFLRTIEGFEEFVQPIDELISEKFIPKLFGTTYPLAELRDLFSLNPKEGGLELVS